ncbi:MAG: GNAT family N-acetyltransferase [Saprospiraceae bacterium]|nr:GNAT family N-acetyltransferase [Saprospiraceae bacterium]
MEIKRTNSEDSDFKILVALLDKHLSISDGDEHAFYDQYNKVDGIKQVVVYYEGQKAVGCGAFKPFDSNSVEIKRMFVRTEYRGRGIASDILSHLEGWASDLGYKETVLETGKKQPEAINLYQKMGYKIIPNYGQYVDVENSVCMSKQIQL